MVWACAVVIALGRFGMLKPDVPAATTAIARPAADARAPAGAQRKLCVPVWQELFDSCHSLRWGLKCPDRFRALARLIREPHLTAAFRLDCKYVTLAATLSHPCRCNERRRIKTASHLVKCAGATGPAAFIDETAMTVALSQFRIAFCGDGWRRESCYRHKGKYEYRLRSDPDMRHGNSPASLECHL
jgi:hypothetical protein